MATKQKTYRSAVAGRMLCGLLLIALAAANAVASGQPPARRVRRTPAAFTRDMPVSEAIDILRNATSPPLNIVVYWKDLDANAGISRDTAIGFDGVKGLRLRQYLEILLASLSATSLAPLAYTVDHGVIVIATADRLPKPREVTRVYDVTDLVGLPSRPALFDMPMFPVMMYGSIPRRALGTLGPYGTTRGRPNARSSLRRGVRRR